RADCSCLAVSFDESKLLLRPFDRVRPFGYGGEAPRAPVKVAEQCQRSEASADDRRKAGGERTCDEIGAQPCDRLVDAGAVQSNGHQADRVTEIIGDLHHMAQRLALILARS